MRYWLFSKFAVLGLVSGLMPSGSGQHLLYSYITDAKSYGGSPGSVVLVNLYLLETLTRCSTSFINSKGGLTKSPERR